MREKQAVHALSPGPRSTPSRAPAHRSGCIAGHHVVAVRVNCPHVASAMTLTRTSLPSRIGLAGSSELERMTYSIDSGTCDPEFSCQTRPKRSDLVLLPLAQ